MNNNKHILITYLFCIIFCGAACGCSGDLEDIDLNRQSIIGGNLLPDIPAVGAVLYFGNMSCTGTLVGPRTVLTAAHCLCSDEFGYLCNENPIQPMYLKFLIGSDVNTPQYVLKVDHTEVYPDYLYDGEQMLHDIAMLTLKEPAPIDPLEVVSHMDQSWEDTKMLFVGYGVTNGYSKKEIGAGTKRGVWLPITEITDTTFLAGDQNANTCRGDSGGPALYQTPEGKYQVAGVTSCSEYAFCNGPGISFRVDPYLNFLRLSKQCDGVSAQGRCDGDTLYWCQDGVVQQKACAEEDQICSYDKRTNSSHCTKFDPQDPCKGETTEGRCSDGQLIWCGVNYKIFTEDCVSQGKICKMGYEDYYQCL